MYLCERVKIIIIFSFCCLETSVVESSPVPGLDTLEEGEDKKRFFSNLEGSQGSPLDYSELNRQLGETGQSSLTLRY